MPKTPTVPQFRAEFYTSLTVAELVERTVELIDRAEVADLDRQPKSTIDAHLYAVEREQHRRCVASKSVARSLARLEDVARGMSDDELDAHARLLDTYPAMSGVVPAAKAVVSGEQARRRAA